MPFFDVVYEEGSHVNVHRVHRAEHDVVCTDVELFFRDGKQTLRCCDLVHRNPYSAVSVCELECDLPVWWHGQTPALPWVRKDTAGRRRNTASEH